MIFLAFALLVFVRCVHGWGDLVHETVGFVAMFLAPKALSFVQTSLGSTYNESLGPAAIWADQVKLTTHFFDNPPTSRRDTGMITKLLEAQFSNSVNTWTDSLVTRIQTGDFESSAASWISCSSTTTPLSRRSIEDDIAGVLDACAITPLQCPLFWAQEANAFDCTVVFNFTTGEDLCTSSYFIQAVPVIELQIAKQGFRLAAWLNVLFDGATDLP